MASSNHCTSFPYILYHTCTLKHKYMCVCVCAKVCALLSCCLCLSSVLRRFIMEACHWRPSYQDILTGIVFWSYMKFVGSVMWDLQLLIFFSSSSGVQLRLPTHDELKVLETVALTSFFCLCTPKAFSVTLSLPRCFNSFSLTWDQTFLFQFLEVPICCISWTETTSCAAGCRVVKLTENGSERTLFPLRHKTDFD